MVAASTDTLEKASETVRRSILHATGFLVRPDNTIMVSQYSSGPIGRLVWQDIVALVQFAKKQAK